MFSACFTRPGGTSECCSYPVYPRRNLSPPLEHPVLQGVSPLWRSPFGLTVTPLTSLSAREIRYLGSPRDFTPSEGLLYPLIFLSAYLLLFKALSISRVAILRLISSLRSYCRFPLATASSHLAFPFLK